LSEIDARSVGLNFNFGAHFPEERENESDNSEEAQNDNPNNFQNVRDEHKDRTTNSTADSRSPSAINFMPRRSSGQASDEQYHESNCCHRCGNNDENHLYCFNPEQLEMENDVEHDDRERSAAIHCRTENAHANQQHDGRQEGRKRNPRYA
jgi:hypothetical protein